MASRKKGKTIPCEGCRERKKKCTAGQPCERCKRLGIKCYYLKPTVPVKSDSAHVINSANTEIQHQLDFLEDVLANMERQLFVLKNNKTDKQTENLITDWKFKMNKEGGISIHTDILSYSNLLKHLDYISKKPSNSFLSIIKQPTLASLSACGGFLLKNPLSAVMRKGQFKATLRSIQLASKTALVTDSSNMNDKKELLLQLVDAYFSCTFYNKIIFHKKTFYDLFVTSFKKNPQSTPSPVIYALSATLLTMRCRHVMAIIPYNQQIELGDYYFNKARTAISIQFDEPTLETMITYLYMSRYKANTMQPADAEIYLDIALRIRQILADTTYHQPPTLPKSTNLTKRISRSKSFNNYLGEYECFQRLLAAFQETAQHIQFLNNQRGVPLKNQKDQKPRLFQFIFKQVCTPNPLADETQDIIRAIMKEQYIDRMARVMDTYFSKVRPVQSEKAVPLSFLMNKEQELNHVYFQEIQLDFRLNPLIFQDSTSDVEFKNKLSEDGRCDLYSISIAARYYQSLIALYEPFLPYMPTFLSDLPLLLSEQPNNNNNNHRSDTIEDDIEPIVSVHSLRAQTICYHSSIKVARLLEYQCTVLDSCTIPLPTLLCAWDNLLRNACLGMTENDYHHVSEYLTRQEIQTAREYAIRCIEIVRRGHLFHAAEREIWEHYERFEQQLLTALCQPASPTAKYWEPVSN